MYRATVRKGSWTARQESESITHLCGIVDFIVGWCDAFDLVLDVMDRTGSYTFRACGAVVTFEYSN